MIMLVNIVVLRSQGCYIFNDKYCLAYRLPQPQTRKQLLEQRLLEKAML